MTLDFSHQQHNKMDKRACVATTEIATRGRADGRKNAHVIPVNTLLG